jgi:hypothetical protein
MGTYWPIGLLSASSPLLPYLLKKGFAAKKLEPWARMAVMNNVNMSLRQPKLGTANSEAKGTAKRAK